MQRIFGFILTFTCLISISSFSQSDKHFKKLIVELDSAKGIKELEKAEENFSQLIKENKRLKQSLYYAALANLMLAFEVESNLVDDYCRKADMQLQKLDSLSPNNSEISVLFAMSAAAKITVDPANRSHKFGPLANKYAERAISLNGENPRAHLIKAKTVMNAPAKLGGGPKFAMKYYQKSLDKYKTFKPLADTEPNWGQAMAKREMEECKLKLSSK